MAAQQNFRSAFNGFNREDVVHYIEYINTKHTSEINQLKAELELLRGAGESDPTEVTKREFAEAERDVLQSENELLKAQLSEMADMEKLLAEALEEKDQLAAQLADLQAQQAASESRMEEELAAYRRAERAERIAQERAQQMYQQAHGIIADTTVKVDSAAAQIGQLSESVMAQLRQLQEAVSGSNEALKDAAAGMYAICPATEE